MSQVSAIIVNYKHESRVAGFLVLGVGKSNQNIMIVIIIIIT